MSLESDFAVADQVASTATLASIAAQAKIKTAQAAHDAEREKLPTYRPRQWSFAAWVKSARPAK